MSALCTAGLNGRLEALRKSFDLQMRGLHEVLMQASCMDEADEIRRVIRMERSAYHRSVSEVNDRL